jgi:hypothetical protein
MGILMNADHPSITGEVALTRDGNRSLWKAAFALAILTLGMVAAAVLKSGSFDTTAYELFLSSLVILLVGTIELRKVKVSHLN